MQCIQKDRFHRGLHLNLALWDHLCLTVLNKAGYLDFAQVFARFELRPVRILNFVQFTGKCTT